jgi:hypothetical protein
MAPASVAIRDAIDEGAPNPLGDRFACIAIIFGVLSTVFVAARLLTRCLIQRHVWLDDYLIVVALVRDILANLRPPFAKTHALDCRYWNDVYV